jgi:hypothetical protein
VDIITSIHHFILFSFFLAFVLVFFCPFFCASSSSLFIMGDVPVPASSALLAIVRRREEAHRVSNVLDSLGRLPTTLVSGLNLDDDEDDEDDKDDDNKGRASAVPSWELVARSWLEKKANKKEQVSEEQEDMEEVVEFPNQEEEEEEEEEEEDVVSEESDPDFVPPTADDDQGQKAATASAPHLIL